MSKQVAIKQRQTLADIALQEYGSIAGMSLIIEDNQAVLGDLTGIPAGTVLFIRQLLPALEVINKQAVNYFQTTNQLPATDIL